MLSYMYVLKTILLWECRMINIKIFRSKIEKSGQQKVFVIKHLEDPELYMFVALVTDK